MAQQEVAKGNKSQIKFVLSQNFKKLIFNIGQTEQWQRVDDANKKETKCLKNVSKQGINSL